LEIPLQAPVECTDGVGGRSLSVLVNPVNQEVTHLVVALNNPDHTEIIVAVEHLLEPIAGRVQLNCTQAEMERFDPFCRQEFVEKKMSDILLEDSSSLGSPAGDFFYWPWVTNEETIKVPVEAPVIPEGEVAVSRGDRVEATDGGVGRVDEFVVDFETCRITHLVMRQGHLWGQRDVIIPVSAIGETRDDTIYLKLDKKQIEALPTFPIQRRWS
jgi:hypothetical protein